MKKPFYLMLIVVLIFTACQSNTKKASDDINTIRNLVDEAIAGIRAKDINQILNSYSSDAIEMPPNQPIIVGIEAIIKEWELWYSDTTYLHEKYTEPIDNIEVSESGDLGYVRTTSHFFRKTTDGIYEQVQKNIFIYKKIEGTWKCIITIWNDNNPMEGQ
jgi:ketosteroid isomerase-like protein